MSSIADLRRGTFKYHNWPLAFPTGRESLEEQTNADVDGEPTPLEKEGTARGVADHRYDLARGDHGRAGCRAVHPDLGADQGTGEHSARNRAGTNGTAFTYTLSITPSSGLTPASLNFQIQTSAGLTTLVTGSAIQVIGPQGCLEATYTFSTNVWAAGSAGASTHACTPPGTSTTLLTSGMQIYLATGTTNLAGQGDTLVAVGVGSFSGTVAEALP
jgi:hypothetical protein